MRSKKVWRYYCDFCKKSGCRKDAIEKHEKYCTMNPNRHCRMCDLVDLVPESINRLKESIKKTKDAEEINDGFMGAICPAEYDISILRDVANNCPACIMAAIRQSDIFLMDIHDFVYSEECKSFFEEYNDSKSDYY